MCLRWACTVIMTEIYAFCHSTIVNQVNLPPWPILCFITNRPTTMRPSQWHRKQFDSRGAQFPALRIGILYCALHYFVVSFTTEHCRKVQYTVTRTEIGQRWPTARGQSDLWPFKVTLCQSWFCQPIELGWLRSTCMKPWFHTCRSSVDTNSVSRSVSEILYSH